LGKHKELRYTQAISHVLSPNGIYASLCSKPNVLLSTSNDKCVNGQELFKVRLLEQEGFTVLTMKLGEWRALEE
jgi:hypothetical protein